MTDKISTIAGIAFFIFIAWLFLGGGSGSSSPNTVTIDCNKYTDEAKQACWDRMDELHYESQYGSQRPTGNFPKN